jgi:DNA-binding NarL/FixJ family response regulator
MKRKEIRVFHLEDYKIIRDGVRFLLSQSPEIEVVGGARDAEELLTILPTLQIDILLLDIYLDGMENNTSLTGFEICEIINSDFAGIKVIAHTMYDGPDNVTRMMDAGAMGFVSKKTGYEELIEAIKTVHSGKRYICSEASKNFKNISAFLAGESTLKTEKQIFSGRELEVLTLLAKGYSTKHIATSLYITEKTVESHRKNMVDKASAKNTVELVTYALAKGIIKI